MNKVSQAEVLLILIVSACATVALAIAILAFFHSPSHTLSPQDFATGVYDRLLDGDALSVEQREIVQGMRSDCIREKSLCPGG